MEGAIPYFIFLGLTLVVYRNGEYHSRNLFVFLTLIIMTLFAGFRDISVGTDTGSYVRAFLRDGNNSLEGTIKDVLTKEPGYAVLQLIVRSVTNQYWVLLSSVAGICSALVLNALERYSLNKTLSLFVFITLGYYTFCFNAARQAIAMSIFLFAIPCLLNKSFIRYCVVVFIAAMFHKSVLISIPLYFLFRMKYSVKSVALVIIVGIVVANILPSILVAASDIEGRYALYSSYSATGGYFLTAFYVVYALFFIVMRNYIGENNENEYDIYLQMLICGSVIYLIVSLTGSYVELTRFAAYFQISSIFLWPYIYNAQEKYIPKPVMPVVYGCFLVYFYIFITSMAALTPYKFNSQIF